MHNSYSALYTAAQHAEHTIVDGFTGPRGSTQAHAHENHVVVPVAVLSLQIVQLFDVFCDAHRLAHPAVLHLYHKARCMAVKNTVPFT